MDDPPQPEYTEGRRPGVALAGGTYATVRGGVLVLPLLGDEPAPPLAQFVHAQLRALVLNPAFPCLGARAAFNQRAYRFGMYAGLGSDEATGALRHDLRAFIAEQPAMGSAFTTFVASFDGPLRATSGDFERLFWQQASRLAAPMTWPGTRRCRRIRTTPDSPSASAGGPSSCSGCIRGVHAGRAASRGRRSSSTPTTSSSGCVRPEGMTRSRRPSGSGTPPSRGARTRHWRRSGRRARPDSTPAGPWNRTGAARSPPPREARRPASSS